MDSEPSAPPTAAAPVPYWQERGGIAPIKAEYVLWEKMKSGAPALAPDDDAAEGRTAESSSSSRAPRPSATSDLPPASVSTPTLMTDSESAPAADSTHDFPADGADGSEPPAKKVRLSGAQKKAAARAKSEIAWQEKKAAQAAARAEGKEGEGGGRVKAKGQNKGRKFDHRAGEDAIKLCLAVSKGNPCARLESGTCRFDHDLASYIASRLSDITLSVPSSSNDLTIVSVPRTCPLFLSLGACPYGFKCRFGLSHMKQVGEGEGVLGSGWELMVDTEKVEKLEREKGEGLKEIREKGEGNVISMDRIKEVRGQGLLKEDRFPLSTAYLLSIGEPLDTRENPDGGDKWKNKGKGKGRGKNGRDEKKSPKVEEEKSTDANVDATPSVIETDTSSAMDIDTATAPIPASIASESLPSTIIDVDSHPSRSALPDLAPIRACEKRRLDFRGKLYLAPLTTVGNLPFRRLCGDFGNDISCSEMGLAQEFLNGNSSEWSLVRRHPSEKIFGIQVCGSKPQALVPAAEAIVKSCDIDFLDVNCGCPIDLVFNKGAGSALLAHATKLGKSLIGMSKVLGEVPLTIKIRNGVTASTPVAHKLIPRMQSEWGVSAVTLHGRSRQQRYKHSADYAYIAQCAKVLREAAADEGLAPMPIFGNGDAYDYRTYYENMEASGVDGIMIARGALVKPWIFTEIKERRDWDISSRERLDMVGTLASYGIEHWGSDTMGLNTTRRFLCEALSFQHRYVPVGLLERLPMTLNERAFPYKGRDELETLLASDQSADWVKITSMFLGPPPEDWSFQPKHKANAADTGTEVQG